MEEQEFLDDERRQKEKKDQKFSDEIEETLIQSYDEIQNSDIGESAQFEENRPAIKGREIIDLFFKWTRDETAAKERNASNVYADKSPPLPETLERMEKLVKGCIADGVTIGDVKLVKGNLEQDFDVCQFLPKGVFLLIKQRKILSTLRDNDILIRPKLEELLEKIQASVDDSPQDAPADDDCVEITFSKRGENWEVGIKNILIFNDRIGLPYIEYAFQKPHQDIPCLDLAKLIKQPGIAEAGKSLDLHSEGYEGVGQASDNMAPSSDGSVKDLDDENRQIWLEKIRDLQHDLDEMDESSPEYNVTKESIEEVNNQLSVFYDSKGNLRKEKLQEEKARINVHRAIKSAKAKIIAELPEMKEYLKHIKTGATVTFNPPEGLKIRIK